MWELVLWGVTSSWVPGCQLPGLFLVTSALAARSWVTSFLPLLCCMVQSGGNEEEERGRENVVYTEFKWCLQGLGKCNSVGAVCWQFCNSSPWIRDRMKSLGPNQRQLIRSQWEIYQLIAAGTQRAEVPKTGWRKVMKLDISATQCRTTSRSSYGLLSPSCCTRNRDPVPKHGWGGKWPGARLEIFRGRNVCKQAAGGYEKDGHGFLSTW